MNGVELYYETVGSGPQLVLTHGSWTDGSGWAPSVAALAGRYEVVTWDRRGHSRSESGAGPGSRAEDAADLAALIEHLGGGPVHVAGNSYGAIVTLTLVTTRPELVASAAVHEPPALALLEGSSAPDIAAALASLDQALGHVTGLIEAGDHRAAAEHFVDHVALGPGSWEQLPDQFRAILEANAPTFLDEARDPTSRSVDAAALAATTVPLLFTSGSESPSFFSAVIGELAVLVPAAQLATIAGAGHIPHTTHPDQWVATLLAFHDTIATSATRGAAMNTERFDVTAADGAPIAVWVKGRGPALVMVHGSIADHTTFDSFVAVLGEHFTTYAMDRRGFGATPDVDDYTIEVDFADVAAVVDAVAACTGGPIVLWGHSYGANCAIGGAASSANVSQLVVYEPSLGLAYPPGSIERIDAALADGDHDAAIVAVLVNILEMTADDVDTLRADPLWPVRLAAAPTVPRECRVEQDWIYRPGQFDTITAPTLLLTGSDSVADIVDATERAAAAIPRARVQVLDGHGHFAHKTDPAAVTEIIRNFVAS